MISRLSNEDLEHVFEDGVAVITCPRCAAVYKSTREHFAEWQAKQA
jgi:molecular chaperone Hsp33